MTRLVALHGFLGRPKDWQAVANEVKHLRPDIQFEAVNLFENPQDATLPLDEWAQKFNQQQKNQHVEKNILLGYSLGGRLSLQAALDKPGLWDEVVLVSTHPGLPTEEEKKVRQSADLNWAEKFANSKWSELMDEWNDQPVFIESHEPTRQEAEYDRATLARVLVNWSLANQDFVEDGLRSLKPKLHWLVGEKDLKFKERLQNLKKSGLIGDLGVLKGAGHRALFDSPKELARWISRRLKID